MFLEIDSPGYPLPHEPHNTSGYPSRERLEKGPVALIECIEEIPCNPCEQACPQHAITIGEPITNCPYLDEDKCIGCGLCISQCPGLAIFLIDLTHSQGSASVSFPYEYLPLPKEGQAVRAVNRTGEPICSGTVVRVQNLKTNDHTLVVTIAVPREYATEVRGILRAQGGRKDG